MYSKTKEVGDLGEKIAEDYLKKKGYKILDKNYEFKISKTPKKGEIDIIAKPRRNIFEVLRGKKDDTIHFIEVKTLQKTQEEFFHPEEKVDFKKSKKLIKTAESWLMKNKIPLNTKWQIDIIAILLEKEKAKISHFENAIPYF
ncbi:hypothetical protein AMJ49_00220 [Parcubacteria bacterium DG_74_2]|nr:MAG: hypothetical protein AMJ49_00220 [Parcubacteria bacterium DG_74_2]